MINAGDYEEGTFTPELGGSDNHSTYHADGSGMYTKVGKIVDVHMIWSNININDSATGFVLIAGLPFTSQNFQYSTTTDHYMYNVGWNTGRIQSWYVTNSSTTVAGIESVNGAGWSSWLVGNFTAAQTYLRVHLTYKAE